MLRHALLFASFAFVGCAAPRASALVAGDAPAVRASAPAAETTPESAPAVRPEPALGALTVPSPEEPSVSMLSALSTQGPPPPPGRAMQRFTLKGGYWGSTEDGLDDGYVIDLSWMRFMSPNFASEFEIGYLDASGENKGVDRDVWSIPIMGNGRLTIPLGDALEIYGGLGLGTFYYEADAKAAGIKVNADGFLFGGDAYFGGSLFLGDALTLGLEGKYYVTDNTSDLDGGLDAYVVLLTVGFRR